MNLSEYIKAERGNGKALAEKLEISPSYLSQIASFPNGPSPATCVAIEKHQRPGHAHGVASW
jgi:DNA-binding transcriptional regulator YdaS (Cro superfamily)